MSIKAGTVKSNSGAAVSVKTLESRKAAIVPLGWPLKAEEGWHLVLNCLEVM